MKKLNLDPTTENFMVEIMEKWKEEFLALGCKHRKGIITYSELLNKEIELHRRAADSVFALLHQTGKF